MKAPGGEPGADRRGRDRIGDGSDLTCAAPRPQAVPPIERHGPIPSDKVACYEVARVDRLVGVWQGPGSIAELSRRRR